MSYARGVSLSALGMLIISPDATLLRLVQHADDNTILFYRTLLMGITLALALRYTPLGGGPSRRPWRVDKVSFFAAALLSVASICFVNAVTRTTVANALVLLATMPLVSAVLGWMILGEKPRPHTWAAILLGFTGITIVFSGSLSAGNWVGDLFALGAALAHGLNLVLLRMGEAGDEKRVLCLGAFLAAAAVLPFAQPLSVTPGDLAILSLLGLLILPLALGLFLGGTQHVPAAEVALVALLETTFGSLWAWLVLGETPATVALVGGSMVVGAVILNSTLSVLKRRDRAPQQVGG